MMDIRLEGAAPSRRLAGLWLVLACAGLLGGCGGGSSGSGDAVADAAGGVAADIEETVGWRNASVIDVTGDGDWPRLLAVGTPARGAATLVDGRVRYEPPARWFGRDAVAVDVQDAPEATPRRLMLGVTVQAELRLRGAVGEPAFADAIVEARLGDRRYESVADAEGRYELVVTSADPDEFLSVRAGSGNATALQLRSLVGDVAALAAVATADGVVSADTVPALQLTHATTEHAQRVERGVTPLPRLRPGLQPVLEP